MIQLRTGSRAIGLLSLAALPAGAGGQPAPVATLSYQQAEGQNLNAFYRRGKVAAHLLLRSGQDPRILVAFPAGNSGVGLWFDHLGADARWRLDAPPVAKTLRDALGRPLYGIVTRATINAPRLSIKQALLSNVRFLRDYQAVGTFPAEVAVPMAVTGRTIDYRRDRIDGQPGYRLTIRVLRGQVDAGGVITGDAQGIALEITALTGDPPLTPIDGAMLLNAKAAADPIARNALRFLSYREKFLAGSWRFNTYFGRDTLMSVQLLMPVLQPAAIEAGLGSVIARLSPTGEVAHEEGLSEFAVIDRKRQGDRSGDAATLDYGMVDDDYMLAPVAEHYLLDRTEGRARAARFLAGQSAGNAVRMGKALVANLRFVVEQARPFADDPRAATLIAIKPGRMSGEWRDSDEGLGRGTLAYDVNAVLVPAALDAAERLLASGVLDPHLTAADRDVLAQAGRIATVWRIEAPRLFVVTIPAATARAAVAGYATTIGVPANAALASLGDQPLTFHALSLRPDGQPVPIVNSDEGFALLFTRPDPTDLDTYVAASMRPFPAGLMTDVGMVVANPAFDNPAAQARFTKAQYHGTVVWSWQQALFAAGLARQIARTDLPADVRRRLMTAQTTLWRAIKASRTVQSSELWSWAYRDGRYVVAPFGAGSTDVDESNAAQLWSTVYLAVQPPR